MLLLVSVRSGMGLFQQCIIFQIYDYPFSLLNGVVFERTLRSCFVGNGERIGWCPCQGRVGYGRGLRMGDACERTLNVKIFHESWMCPVILDYVM